MKKITFLLMLLTASLGFSQALPFDFEASQPFIGDSGAAVAGIDDGSGTNQVLEVIGNGTAWDNAQVTFAAPLDLSDDANNTIKLRMRSTTAGAAEVNEHLLKFEVPTTGGTQELTFTTTGTAWQDIEVDFGAGLSSYGKLVIMVDWGDGAGANQGSFDQTETYLIDDISIGATTPGTDATLSDLQVDATTITGFASGTIDYTYVVADGTTIVPTVTATTADGTASAVVTPAGSLPGDTTVVVTAGDGTTTKTYTVSFIFPVELPIDFQTGQPFVGDSGAGVSAVDDGTGTNQVLQVVGNGTAWDNAQVTFTTPVDLSDDANNTIRFRMKSNTSDIAEENWHLLKFELPTTGGTEELTFKTTGQAWTDVEVNFGAGLNSYSKLVLMVDWGDGTGVNQGSFDQVETYLVDDISVGATVLGIEDYQLINFSSYPNPTRDSWTVKTKNEKMSSIHVFDVLGKSVLSLKPNKTEAKIDGSSLKAGIYFAQVKTASGASSLKLIKQ